MDWQQDSLNCQSWKCGDFISPLDIQGFMRFVWVLLETLWRYRPNALYYFLSTTASSSVRLRHARHSLAMAVAIGPHHRFYSHRNVGQRVSRLQVCDVLKFSLARCYSSCNYHVMVASAAARGGFQDKNPAPVILMLARLIDSRTYQARGHTATHIDFVWSRLHNVTNPCESKRGVATFWPRAVGVQLAGRTTIDLILEVVAWVVSMASLRTRNRC